MKILILNDRRAGHLNQCVAFAKLQGAEYVIADVRYKSRWLKALSYLLDWFHVYTDVLFTCMLPEESFDIVVAAGSTTAYPLKVLSKRFGVKSVSMMLPRGYRYDYDTIFAQEHDAPPEAANIIPIPANFSFIVPSGLFRASGKSVGVVIGGDNSVFHFSAEQLKHQLSKIFEAYPDYTFAVTTSPRTTKEIEAVVALFSFEYSVIFSENPINPIPDFLDQCERVFITQDSTSMISEAVSYGNAYIEVLPLEGGGENKFSRLVQRLEEGGYLHCFDGTFANANRKIDFHRILQKAGF